MKDINEMSYEELIQLEEIIKTAKSKFYLVNELWVIKDHFCLEKVVGNYTFFGDQTSVDYYDLFSGDFIGQYNIFAPIPSLNKVLDDYSIHYKKFMTKTEIKEIWKQYKNNKKVYHKK